MSRFGDSRSLLTWVYDPHSQKQRWRLRAMLHGYHDKGNVNGYMEKMTDVWNSNSIIENIFIWALIDSPEAYRQSVLEHIENQDPETYNEIVSLISEVQEANGSARGITFQCVAFPEYLSTLPESAQKCFWCRGKFAKGADMIWRHCKKHAWCLECFERCSSQSLKPPFLDCPCIAPEVQSWPKVNIIL